jgi:hypothetical protein
MPYSPRPSSIKIFLADGAPTALRIIEKSNWIGQGVVFPRSGFAEARKRPEFAKTGIYVLSGPSETTGRDRVYIGEGDPVLPRLDSHAAKKDFWTQGIVFISKDSNLNKAHVQYLEARLCELAASAKRVEIENGNTPGRPTLSESDQAEMEGFLEEMLICFPVLGQVAFERIAERVARAKLFRIKGPEAEGQGFESEEGFVVKSGAVIRKAEVNTTPAFVVELRKQLVESGVISTEANKWVLSQDYAFSSPSTAAAVVLGRNANGRIEWKDDSGKTLKDFQSGQDA